MNAIYLQQLGSLGSRAGLLGGLGAGLANAMRTPQQSKLDRARAYLKEAAKRHPEWKVGKADEDWGF